MMFFPNLVDFCREIDLAFSLVARVDLGQLPHDPFPCLSSPGNPIHRPGWCLPGTAHPGLVLGLAHLRFPLFHFFCFCFLFFFVFLIFCFLLFSFLFIFPFCSNLEKFKFQNSSNFKNSNLKMFNFLKILVL
jgi:hypothetical protein